jgi:hypothetical protein
MTENRPWTDDRVLREHSRLRTFNNSPNGRGTRTELYSKAMQEEANQLESFARNTHQAVGPSEINGNRQLTTPRG